MPGTPKTLAILAWMTTTLAAGGIGGLGLAHFAESGDFTFYKQARTPRAPAQASADGTAMAGYYPMRRDTVPDFPEGYMPPQRALAPMTGAYPGDEPARAPHRMQQVAAVEPAMDEAAPEAQAEDASTDWPAPEPEAGAADGVSQVGT